MHLDPSIVTLAIVTSGIGYIMVAAGLKKGALELRRRRRNCPSCGRVLDRPVCPSCAS